MQIQGNAVLRADIMGVMEDATKTESWFIGAKIATPAPVDACVGQYPVIRINGGNLMRNVASPIQRGSEYPLVKGQLGTGTYTTQEYGFRVLVHDDDAKDVSRFFDLATTQSRLRLRQLQLGHEIRVKNALFNTSNFSVTTSATAYTSANIGTFDVCDDIEAALNEITGRGESIEDVEAIIPEAVWRRIRTSTRLQNRVRGTVSTDTTLSLSEQSVADAFGIRKVHVARARYDSSGEGASTSTIASIWSNTYIWLGKVATGGNVLDGAIRTLFWNQSAPSVFLAEQYRDDDLRGEIIRVRQHVAEFLPNTNRGQLLVTQYS